MSDEALSALPDPVTPTGRVLMLIASTLLDIRDELRDINAATADQTANLDEIAARAWLRPGMKVGKP